MKYPVLQVFFCVFLSASSFYHFLCLAFLSVDIFTISSIVKFQVPSLPIHLRLSVFFMSTCQRLQSLFFHRRRSHFDAHYAHENNKERVAAVADGFLSFCVHRVMMNMQVDIERYEHKKISTKKLEILSFLLPFLRLRLWHRFFFCARLVEV